MGNSAYRYKNVPCRHTKRKLGQKHTSSEKFQRWLFKEYPTHINKTTKNQKKSSFPAKSVKDVNYACSHSQHKDMSAHINLLQSSQQKVAFTTPASLHYATPTSFNCTIPILPQSNRNPSRFNMGYSSSRRPTFKSRSKTVSDPYSPDVTPMHIFEN